MDAPTHQILDLLLEFNPEISLFMVFRSLSSSHKTHIDAKIKGGEIRYLCHRNSSKVQPEFLSQLVSSFNTQNLRALNFEFSTVSDSHFSTGLRDEKVKSCISGLEEINLNACREISDKTVV